MKLVGAFLLYFLLCMIAFRCIHLILRRYKFSGLERDAFFFGFGFVAWFLLKYCLVGVELGREMARYWPVGFIVILAALFLYDWVQARWDCQDE